MAGTRMLLVRHAESEWNAARRWQGQADPPLSARGREETAAAVDGLRGLVSVAVASDLIRARETAQIIADGLGLAGVEVNAGLREIDVGEWSGLTIAEVEERYAAELAAWRDGTASSAPGGEDRDAFLARITASLEHVAVRHLRADVLVVTHGGTIGRLERHLGCFPGRGPRHLEGRWFLWDDVLKADGDRVALIPDIHEPPPEAR